MLRAFPRRLSIKSHFNPHSVLCHSRSIRIPPPPTTGMIEPGAPIHLNEALGVLPERFEQGRASGELLFFESSAQDVQSGGLKFNIRLCPALQDKSKAKAEVLAKVGASASSESGSPDAKRQRIDPDTGASSNGTAPAQSSSGAGVSKQNSKEPFKPPYVPELFVGSVKGLEGEQDMSILLNKYSLLPHHFLLCPQTFQPQSVPPTPAQLGIAYQLLLSASRHPTRPRKLLAFYNSNPTAGASQPWRHIQFIEPPSSSPNPSPFNPASSPLEEWCRGLSFGGKDDRAVVHPGLPYVHVVHPLPYEELRDVADVQDPKVEEKIVDALAPAVMKCLDLAIDSVRRVEGAEEPGWNLLMTLNHLHLIPRLKPSFALPQPHAPLELNALGYAGYMLVKSQEEQQVLLDIAQTEGSGLQDILLACGVPRAHGEEAEKVLESIHNGGELF